MAKGSVPSKGPISDFKSICPQVVIVSVSLKDPCRGRKERSVSQLPGTSETALELPDGMTEGPCPQIRLLITGQTDSFVKIDTALV